MIRRGGRKIGLLFLIALVAMILIILFGFVGGLRGTLLGAGSDNNWVIVSRGAPEEPQASSPTTQLTCCACSPRLRPTTIASRLSSECSV